MCVFGGGGGSEGLIMGVLGVSVCVFVCVLTICKKVVTIQFGMLGLLFVCVCVWLCGVTLVLMAQRNIVGTFQEKQS